MPTLSLNTPVTVAATGAFTDYTAAAAGVVKVKLWGAGGAGGSTVTGGTAGRGGGGAYIHFDLPVASGDVIRLEVGVRGKAPTADGIGAPGGWPDGGSAGSVTASGYFTGSGGGSTRVYKNGTLIGVAAGGGGGGLFSGGGGGTTTGGPGGYLNGVTLETKSSVAGNTICGTGATQSVGGVSAARTGETASRGTSLQGGNGWADGGNNTNTAGGGGGGGYYGGGGGSSVTTGGYMPGGGGGSSWTHASALDVYMRPAIGPFSGDPDGSTTIATGGPIGTGPAFYGAPGDGKDGQAYLSLTAATQLEPNTPFTVAYSGAATEYTATAAGVVSVKGWGAGGGGGVRPAAPAAGPGGGGAYVSLDIPVAIGDIIKLEVGGGGKVSTTTAAGGLGGWPDGGQGGLVTVADYSSSGGGGSTRVYKNGTLMGVAAGGGGGAGWTGGAGGALIGQQGGVGESKNFGSGSIAGTTVCATGGTQSAGGTAPQRPTETIPTGTSLQGGRGWSDTGNNNNTTGGGGGGGYYGGGGGSANAAAGSQPAGGGGSSYVNAAAHAPIMWAGLGQTPADPSNPLVGRGGNSAAAWPGTAGANGQASLLLTTTASLPTNTRTVLTGTGASQYYTIPTNGMIAVKMWGGGGSGCNLPGTAGSGGLQGEPGATGGYVTAEVPVTAGQLVRFDVGMGGAGTTWTSGVTNGTMVGRGGDGGWPDGGAGGFNVNVISGGGGGSSRIWIDGVLYALAAGGGGDGVGQTDRRPGSGGGLVGQDGTNTLAGYTTGRATGATQSAGGINLYFPADPYMAGAYLRGGRGYAVGATQNANSESCGGGGGGGYYGGGAGGGGNTSTAAAGGAGGSSYLKSGLKGSTDGGSQHIYPGGQDDVDYVIGSAMGGAARLSTTTPTNSLPGADGRIIFAYAPNQTLVSNTKTMVSPTGGPQRFVAPSAGVVKVKLWGGGGSAGIYATATSGTVPGTYGGGCGGFTYAEIPVTAGQVVQIDVAKGGGPTLYTSGTNGSYVGVAAAGGWPDGGNGGFNLNLIPGGGGGSSRVWVDGVLKAVAGGGGASSGDNRNYGGGGGALQGGPITNSVNAPNGLMAYGGTQWAGGINLARSTDVKATGGYLRGGQGYPPGILGRTTHDNSSGYGAGGGYYGGAGGGQSPNYVTGASGGSSYLAPDVVGYTQGGNYGFNSGGSTDPDYVTNVGKGSLLAGNANGAAAYDGLAYYTFTPAGTLPQNADTTLTTVGISEYTVGTAGDLVVRLWGAGGGGSTFSTSTGVTGGGGGYTAVTIPVTVGQVVRFDVGKGGQGGQWTSGASGAYVGRGGDGGWPDGGPAGCSSTSLSGGGGGSSRVWVDGKLAAVAGGGGGSGAGVTSAFSGAGGGTAGTASTNTTGVNAYISTGGNQSGGGGNTARIADNLSSGRYLRGGQGYPTNEMQSAASANAGGGAGGGYYGGGGGGASASIFTAGGGGSGFVGPLYGLTTSDTFADQVVLYSSFDQTIEDDLHRSVNGYNFIGTGQAISSAQSKYGGKSLYLSGAGHLDVFLPTPIRTGDYTFEGWFKNETLPVNPNAQCLFILGEGAAGGVGVFQNGSNSAVYLRHNNTGANDVAVNWSPDTNWNHWAVSRVSGVTRVFKNGVVMITYSTLFDLTATQLHLSAYTTANGDSRFNGWIDDVRITVGVGRYTSAFTPPAAALMTRTAVLTPTSTTTTAGTSAGVPGNTGASGYIAGKGVGAASRSTAGNAADGGDGLIVFNMPGPGDATATGSLPTVTVTSPAAAAAETHNLPIPGQSVAQGYTGATYSYQATATGTYLVEMWGGGGGGVSASGKGGGGAGYTTYQISLVAGDVVTVQVPSGGGSGSNAGSPPGVGGYPDGGTGFNPATLTHKSGGGGSARLYINGTLAAVAGGGGGGSYGGIADDNQGGPGGGSSGVAGTAPGGAPGTSSAGGAGVGNGLAGAAFQGGNGGTTGGINGNGPGGGGGYYGGGGGGQSGGGGSGYINTAHPRYVSGTTTAGTLNQPAGTTSVNYVSGVGVGSVGTSPGGPGRINIYNNTPTPGNASGASNTVTVTPPVGGVDSPPLGAISIGTVLVTPPVATAGVPAFASGGFGPEITMGAPSASAAAQAIVIVPINDSTSLHITAPTVAPFSLDGNIDADIATVHMIAPTGFGSVAQNPVSPAAGDIGTITVVPGEGAASIGQDTIVPIDVTVTVTPPAGTATGQGANSADRTADFRPEWITIRAPGGSAASYGGPDGNAAVSGALPVIPITPPQADFVPLDFIIEGLPSPIVMTLSAPEADGAGNALIVPEPTMENGNPANWYYAKITLAPPVAFPEANADFTVDDMPRAIIVGTPTAAADLGIDLLVPMPAPIVINGADAEPTVDVALDMPPPIDIIPADGTATGGIGGLGEGDIGTVIVTAPDGEVSIPITGTGDIGTITVSAPLGIGMSPASATGALPTIVITAAEGSAEGGASADATGDIGTITVSAPLGGNVANAAVSLPLGTVFVSAPTATPSAGTNISRTIGTVTITAPLGRGEVPGAAAGDIGIITVVSPEGVAYEAIPANATGDIGTILVSAPDGVAEGNVAFNADLPVVYIYAPNGRGEVPADVSADIATIIVEPVLGTGTTDVVRADGELPTVTLTTVDGGAFGNSLGTGTLPVLTVTPPTSTQTGEVDLTTPIDLTIQMVAPQGIGYPVIPGNAEGDLPSILITASDGTATGAVLVQQPLNTVTVSVPVASPSGAVDLITARELAIIVGAPVGEYYREAQVVAGFPTLYVYVPTASVDADGKTASASGVFPVIYVDTPDGFAEVPVVDGTARIKFRRSVTRGAAPATLMPREIAFNEIDGTLLTRDGMGEVQATPLGTLQRLPAVQGTEGTVLRADGTWGAPAPTYPLPVPMEPTGSLVILSEAVVGTAVLSPTIGATIYRPFFVPRTLEISALAFTVVAASPNTVEVGIAPLSLSGVVGAPLVAVSQIVSGTGVQTVAGTAITLEPGWYASTFKVTGAGSATFRAAVAPSAVAADFSAIQGAPAFVSAQV